MLILKLNPFYFLARLIYRWDKNIYFKEKIIAYGSKKKEKLLATSKLTIKYIFQHNAISASSLPTNNLRSSGRH